MIIKTLIKKRVGPDLKILNKNTYYIKVPYYKRGHGEERNIDNHIFPPKGVTPYSFLEAVDVLKVVTKKWVENNSFPPPELAPTAYLYNEDDQKLSSKIRFTLLDISFYIHDSDEEIKDWISKISN